MGYELNTIASNLMDDYIRRRPARFQSSLAYVITVTGDDTGNVTVTADDGPADWSSGAYADTIEESVVALWEQTDHAFDALRISFNQIEHDFCARFTLDGEPSSVPTEWHPY